MIDKFKVNETSDFPERSPFNNLIKDISHDSKLKIFNDGPSQLGKPLVAFAIGSGSKITGVIRLLSFIPAKISEKEDHVPHPLLTF